MNGKLNVILLTSLFAIAMWFGYSLHREPNNVSETELALLKAELRDIKMALANHFSVRTNNTDANQSPDLKSSRGKLSNTANNHILVQPNSALNVALEESTNTVRELTTEEIALEQEIAMEEEKKKIDATLRHLQDSLIQEDVDENWSTKIENKIADNFVKGSADSHALLESDCRSTFCRIVIANAVDSEANPRELLGDLFANSEGFYHSTEDDNGSITTELYVSRNGFDLPSRIHETN